MLTLPRNRSLGCSLWPIHLSGESAKTTTHHNLGLNYHVKYKSVHSPGFGPNLARLIHPLPSMLLPIPDNPYSTILWNKYINKHSHSCIYFATQCSSLLLFVIYCLLGYFSVTKTLAHDLWTGSILYLQPFQHSEWFEDSCSWPIQQLQTPPYQTPTTSTSSSPVAHFTQFLYLSMFTLSTSCYFVLVTTWNNKPIYSTL